MATKESRKRIETTPPDGQQQGKDKKVTISYFFTMVNEEKVSYEKGLKLLKDKSKTILKIAK